MTSQSLSLSRKRSSSGTCASGTTATAGAAGGVGVGVAAVVGGVGTLGGEGAGAGAVGVGGVVEDNEAEYQGCQHLREFKEKYGVRIFRVFQRCLRPGPGGRACIAREKSEIHSCAFCGRAFGRLYACLACAIIGCWTPDSQHARVHAARSGHAMAVDVERTELFCCSCNDYVYDEDFDRAVLGAQATWTRMDTGGNSADVTTTATEAPPPSGSCRPEDEEEEEEDQNQPRSPSTSPPTMTKKPSTLLPAKRTGGKIASTSSDPTTSAATAEGGGDGGGGSRRKRARCVSYRPWKPSQGELMLIKQSSTALVPLVRIPCGLRGLNNLGNTCFMNSILQALLHTPPLRNYFLSDRHNRAVCQRKSSHFCLGCDMDTMFSAAFSGVKTPFSPAQFLYSWWRHAENLAGYEQQDAHEFFISTVDGIHANSEATSPRAKSVGRSGDAGCRCIVHRVFSGLLRSDVMCTICGFTSTTYDPCVDVSLDLEPPVETEKGNHGASGGGAPGGAGGNAGNGKDGREGSAGNSQGKSQMGTGTLLGCLDRFTRAERLGTNEKFFCQRCKMRQESIKQMSVRRLPLVLCFHIKRFEHSSTRKTSRKVDRYLQFPFMLDMTPYLSSTIVRVRHGNRICKPCTGSHASEGSRDQLRSSDDGRREYIDVSAPCVTSKYELFAVVTHSGKIDSGHYVAYLKVDGQWYKCDDAWVTHVDENVVRTQQGYMLYYIKKTLGYKVTEWVADDDTIATDGNSDLGFYKSADTIS